MSKPGKKLQDKTSKPSEFSRRNFLGAGAVIGAAGLAFPHPGQAQSAVPDKFANLKPMRPGPVQSGPDGVTAAATPPPLGALLLNKAAFGPRPGDVAAFNALAGATPEDKLVTWVDAQLLAPNDDIGEVQDRLDDLLLSANPDDVAAYDTIGKTDVQLWTEHALDSDYYIRNRPRWQMERLTILRATHSQWQLREVMFDFWFNHFNVFGNEFPTYGMLPNYDKIIRPHIFGNFGNLLKAIAKSPSMLYYLDNYANTWPNPNENYAREVLELHTLGAIRNYYGAVDPDTEVPPHPIIPSQRAGYTEIDVFQFARALTGWGVSDTTDGSPDTGEFIFRPLRHYNFSDGPINVMDMSIAGPGGGENDVTDILDYLAGHYGTAEYIAWKLCTRLIGEFGDISSGPLPAIVASTAQEFYNRRNDSDQLKMVYRHILTSVEFRTTWGEKVKRPVETIVRAMRATDMNLTFRIDDSASDNIWYRLDDTSHFPFGYAAPTGFPDEREFWQGSGPLIMSWRTITLMLQLWDDTTIPPLLNLAQQTNAEILVAGDRTAENIVNMWMDRALGYALPGANPDRIKEFIYSDITTDLGHNANTPLDNYSGVDTSNITQYSQYQKIIRAVVGLILMSPDAMRR